eukprot:13762884-Alexandrium_andersonii.AAC.1
MACFRPNHPATNARARCAATRRRGRSEHLGGIRKRSDFWEVLGSRRHAGPGKEAHQAIRRRPDHL